MFLNRMKNNYEIVLFGEQEQGFIHEVADGLDPNQMFIQGRLGRESTIVKNQRYVKDFSYLGRPASEIVYLDFTEDSVPFHAENLIKLPMWDGDADDRELYEIIPFLDHIAQKPGDVRRELERYGPEGTA